MSDPTDKKGSLEALGLTEDVSEEPAEGEAAARAPQKKVVKKRVIKKVVKKKVIKKVVKAPAPAELEPAPPVDPRLRLGRFSVAPRTVFFALLGLFIVLRVAHALTAVASFDDEDGYTLAAAFELMGEHNWPYQAYQLSDWENGTLLVVLLALPFCALFGPSLFALKMTGLTISCVTFTGLYMLCKESFGARAALLACLLYIVFPNPVYGYSVTAHGFHPDSMAVQLFLIWYFVKVFKEQAPTVRQFVILGALSGFSVYFAYISVFAVGAGVLPWLVLSLMKKLPRARRFRLGAYVGGGLLGSIPLLTYNVFNGLLGFNVYHGKISSYVNPTDLSDKVKFFFDHTLHALLYFSNPFDPHSATYGIFEKAFWAVALAAVALPGAYRLLRRLRKRPVAATPWAGTYLDAVIPLFVIFTLAIFFNSKHPVGPAHIVPMLLMLLVALAGRLGLLWERGGILGKGLAVALVIGVAVAGVPKQLKEIKPSRLGSGLVIDGRNYPLFFFRALVTLEGSGLDRKEHGARHLLLALPAELTLDNKDYIHSDHAPAFPKQPGQPLPDWGVELKRYAGNPTGTDVKLDKAASMGLALSRLFQRKHGPQMKRLASLDQIMAFVAGYDEKKAGKMLEIIGYNLGPRHDLLTPLRKQMAKKPAAVQRRMERRVAFGMGRATFLPAYFETHVVWCDHEKLPQTLQPDYIKGLGHAVATRMISPVPQWAEDPLCPRRRALFWQGVKMARAPSHDKLGKTNQIKDQ